MDPIPLTSDLSIRETVLAPSLLLLFALGRLRKRLRRRPEKKPYFLFPHQEWSERWISRTHSPEASFPGKTRKCDSSLCLHNNLFDLAFLDLICLLFILQRSKRKSWRQDRQSRRLWNANWHREWQECLKGTYLKDFTFPIIHQRCFKNHQLSLR